MSTRISRAQLIAAEALLLLAGLAVILVIAGFPFGGDDDDSADEAIAADVRGVEPGPAIDEQPETEGSPPPEAPDSGVSDCTPPADRDFFTGNQILSYYGNPYTEHMGILGQHEPEEVVRRLVEQAQRLDEVNGFRGIQPALHMVSTTAQPDPGNDGLYVLHVDEQTIGEWVDLACENGLQLFLDLQIGRNSLQAELDRIRPFLSQPHVHLALDPEFKMDEGEVPGQVIGSYSAEEINEAQEYLQALADEANIPDKVLIVHQFTDDMIERREDIAEYPAVRIIVTMDGFGDPATKAKKFKWYAEPAEFAGIKLFFELDKPLMTDAEVVKTRTDLVIYQ